MAYEDVVRNPEIDPKDALYWKRPRIGRIKTISSEFGDKIDFEIAPEEPYGEKDERAVAQLPADMFKETGLPPVGEVLPLQDNQGNQFRAVVVEITPEAVSRQI
ncbi:hypothetical protein FQR65_LT15787 [Abscondita terminalis]|nr:hypothetical protein FQR65_LT15787 [Abscondita terminalis]